MNAVKKWIFSNKDLSDAIELTLMRATYSLGLSSETKVSQKNNIVSADVLPRFVRSKHVEINDECHTEIPIAVNRKAQN